jgi:hypothetical protein
VLNKTQAAAAILPCDTSLSSNTEDSVSIANIVVHMVTTDVAIVNDASIERFRIDSLRLAWRYAETAVYRRTGTGWRLFALEGAMIPSRPKLLGVPSSTGGFDEYAGRYALSATYYLDVVVEGDHLVVQGPGYDKRRWRASARNIFVPDTGAERSVWIFEQDRTGHVSAVTFLDFGGSSSRFTRITP